MRINWGTGIAITFALFAAGMILLVILCMQQPPDLVSVDYYDREVAFQQQIDKAANTTGLSNPLIIKFDAELRQITIIFPAEMKDKPINGKLHFFKPDNATLDFDIPVQPDQHLTQNVSAREMKSGLWHIQADWKCGNEGYYQKESIVVN